MLRSWAAIAALSTSLVLTACGGEENTTDETAATGEESCESVRAGYASALDPNDIADQFGLDAAGAEVVTLGDDSAVVAGLLRDSLDVGNVDFDAAMKAASEGVPLKIIYVSQTKPEYVFVSRPEISSLDELAGKKVGYHARGSQTDIFARALIRQEAPEIYDEADFLALEESSRRAQALVGERLDATVVEAINLAQLRKQGDYHELGTWGDLGGQAGSVLGTAWVTTEENYQQNKACLTDFVQTMQEGYDRFYTDKEGWLALAGEKIPDVEQSLLPDVYEVYAGQDMYPRSGEPAVTPEIFAANDAFFRELGEWEDPQSEELVAFDLVNAGANADAEAGGS
jgi:ABC-type nitrate/sulfonate/bicarbonate transport system substrate-binding protein